MCWTGVGKQDADCAGQVEIDQDVYSHLLQTGQFEPMRLETDEVLCLLHQHLRRFWFLVEHNL